MLNDKSRIYTTYKHLLLIFIVYVLSQGFLLVATGRWWDDWCYADKDWEHMYEVFRQASLPLEAYINAGLWLLPDNFYKIIVFALFFVG